MQLAAYRRWGLDPALATAPALPPKTLAAWPEGLGISLVLSETCWGMPLRIYRTGMPGGLLLLIRLLRDEARSNKYELSIICL